MMFDNDSLEDAGKFFGSEKMDVIVIWGCLVRMPE